MLLARGSTTLILESNVLTLDIHEQYIKTSASCFLTLVSAPVFGRDLASLAPVIVLPADLTYVGSCPLLSWF